MSSFTCPSCHKQSGLFKQLPNSGCGALCIETKLPLLGSIPVDPNIGRICDEGSIESFKHTSSYSSLKIITNNILEQLSKINKLN